MEIKWVSLTIFQVRGRTLALESQQCSRQCNIKDDKEKEMED